MREGAEGGTAHTVPLAHLRCGDSGVVATLGSTTSHERAKLIALGLAPGATVRVLQRFPAFVVACGHTQVALDRETAHDVRVRPGEAAPRAPGGWRARWRGMGRRHAG
ncbi:MAG TPA: FeoA family protein [Chthonomonadales bacterium]|nr:FeoA family protein [Chthonomonadales bacterium]